MFKSKKRLGKVNILVEEFELVSRYKQLLFKKKINNLDWKVDLKAGLLKFSNGIAYEVNLVGTYTKSNQKFLFANQNKLSTVGPLGYNLALKYQKDLEHFLKTPKLEKHHIHLLAAYISVLENSEAYYLGDYGIGSAVLIVESKFTKVLNTEIFIEALNQVCEQYDINTIKLLKNFARKMNFKLRNNKNLWTLIYKENSVLITIDSLGKIDEVKAIL